MHWCIFKRLVVQEEALHHAAVFLMAVTLGLMEVILGRSILQTTAGERMYASGGSKSTGVQMDTHTLSVLADPNSTMMKWPT